MKKALKITAVLLAMLIAFIPLTFSAQAGEKTNYLVLGDSIGVGAGVVNFSEACYGRIVADTNGYDYSNHALIGYTSGALLAHIKLPHVRSAIRNADVISLSIGGNDFLTYNMVQLGFEAGVKKDLSTFDDIAAKFYKNYKKIIAEIKELNPDAVILAQTLYNPMFNPVRDIYQEAVDRLNNCYRRYLSENPGSIVIVDVGAAFEGHPEYIANDCVHPNAAGNVTIARLVLRTLKNLSLGSKTEPVINNPGVDNNLIAFFKNTIDLIAETANKFFPQLFVI